MSRPVSVLLETLRIGERPERTWGFLMSIERIGYSPKEVAAAWGVDVKTIYKGIHDGTIPAIKLGDRYIVTKPVMDRLANNGNL